MNNITTSREILCAVDLEHESLGSEQIAYAMAQVLGCRLRLIHVDTSLELAKSYQNFANSQLTPVVWEKIKGDILADKARKLRHRIQMMGASDVTFDILMGSPAKEIRQYLKQTRHQFELIVLGKRKRSFFNEFLLGSVANDIVAHASLPTLLVPNGDESFAGWRPAQIVVASGLQPGSFAVSEFGAKLAVANRASLKLVHVLAVRSSYGSSAFTTLNPSEADDLDLFFATAEGQVQHQLDKLAASLGLSSERISTTVLYGKTTEALLNEMSSQNTNLLVVGRHNGIDENNDSLGSVASALARTSRSPLLIVPHAARQEKGKHS